MNGKSLIVLIHMMGMPGLYMHKILNIVNSYTHALHMGNAMDEKAKHRDILKLIDRIHIYRQNPRFRKKYPGISYIIHERIFEILNEVKISD